MAGTVSASLPTIGHALYFEPSANRYPVSNDLLIARIATLHGISSERILLGCGSTEMIRMLVAGLLGPGKNAGVAHV